MKKRKITYGSLIQLKNNRSREMMMISDGYVDTNLFMKKPSYKLSKSEYRGLFVMLPLTGNQSKKNAMRLIDELKNFYIEQRNVKEKVERKKEEIFQEYLSNLRNIEKSYNMSVPFFEPFQLLHVASNKFLGIENGQALIERENKMCLLTEFPSDKTLFTLEPIYKHQSDRKGFSYFGEEVFISSYKKINLQTMYLHYSENLVTAGNLFSKKPQNLDIKMQEDKTDQPKEVLEVNFSSSEKVSWMLRFFDNMSNIESNFLNYGDALWITHLENKAVMKGVQIDDKLDKRISSSLAGNGKIKGVVDFGRNKDGVISNARAINGIWIIERMKKKAGGFVKWGFEFRLKHYLTGLYLSAIKLIEYNKTALCLVHYPDNDAIFEFDIVKRGLEQNDTKNLRFVKTDSLAYLRHKITGSLVSCKTFDIKRESSRKLLQFDSLPASLMRKITDDIVLKISKVNIRELSDSNLLLSCKPYVEKFSYLVKNLAKVRNEKVNDDNLYVLKLLLEINNTIMNCIECTKILKDYIELKVLTENSIFDTELINQRKKILKELNFIEIYCTILDNLFDRYDLDYITHGHAVDNDNLSDFHAEGNSILGDIGGDQMDQSNNQARLSKAIKTNYTKAMKYSKTFCQDIYNLLIILAKNAPEIQTELFAHTSSFMKHFTHFDKSMILTKIIIKDNQVVLGKLTKYFFGSLKLLLDSISKTDPKRILKIDLLFMDENSILYNENLRNDTRSKSSRKYQNFYDVFSATTMNSKRSRPINLIVYILILLSKGNRNHLLLDILATSCVYHSDNFAQNQEHLFAIFCDNEELIKFMLSDLRITHNQRGEAKLVATFADGDKLILDDVFDLGAIVNPELNKTKVRFVSCQLRLYATLCKGRNIKWKKYLVKLFPFNELQDQIFNTEYSNEFLASLWSFAFYLHIDNEPLHKVTIPSLCKLFTVRSNEANIMNLGKFMRKLSADQTKSSFQYMEELYLNLLDICEASTMKLEELFEKSLNSNSLKRFSQVHTKESIKRNRQNSMILRSQVSDLLLKDFFYLMNRILDFGVINYTSQYTTLQRLVKFCIPVLELTSKAPILSAVINKSRKLSFKKLNQKERLLKNFCSFIDFCCSTADLKEFTGKKVESVKKKEDETNEIKMTQNNDLRKNFFMRNYFLLTSKIESTLMSSNFEETIEIKLKRYACEALNKVMDIREDFLLENFITWYSITRKNNRSLSEQNFDATMSKLIKQKCKKFLPNIMKTGVKSIDEDHDPDKNFLLQNLKMKLKFDKDASKGVFKKYVQDAFIYDFDYLMLNDPMKQKGNSLVGLEFLCTVPSLLYSFAFTENSKLQTQLLELILRCFSQRQRLLSNIKRMNLYFKMSDKNLYFNLGKKLNNLRLTIQKCDNIIGPATGGVVDYAPLAMLSDEIKQITMILFKDSFLNKETDEFELKDNVETHRISGYRQKLARHLKAHQVILYFIRRKMWSLPKILIADFDFPAGYKKAFIVTLNDCFNFLIFFCKYNQENQDILYEMIDDFMIQLNFDVGQMDLLCSIFDKNPKACKELLKDDSLIQKVISLIRAEGRKRIYLNFFKTVVNTECSCQMENVYLILNAILPVRNLADEWTNYDIFFMRKKSDGTLEFDVSEELADRHRDPISILTSLQKGDSTYRDEPVLYHIELVEILTMILQITPYDFVKNKIREIFTISYLLGIFCLEDNFVKIRSDSSERARRYGDREKLMAHFMNGFCCLKIRLVSFLFNLYLKKINKKSFNFEKDSPMFCSLIKLETYRISNFGTNSELLSALEMFESAEKHYDRYDEFILGYFTRVRDRENEAEEEDRQNGVESNEMTIRERERKERMLAMRVSQTQRAIFKRMEQESPYFYYMRYILKVFTSYIQSRKSADVAFELETSEDGRLLIDYVELFTVQKIKLFDSKISEKSSKTWIQFFSEFKRKPEEVKKALKRIEIAENFTVIRIETEYENIHGVNQATGNTNGRNFQRENQLQEEYKERYALTYTSNFTTDEYINWDSMKTWDRVVDLIRSNKVVRDLVVEERMALAYSFLNFDKLLKKDLLLDSTEIKHEDLENCVLKKEDLIKKLITYIENQIHDQNATKNVINLLYIFSIMIKKSKVMKEIQNLFNNSGAVKMILSVLTNYKLLEFKMRLSLFKFLNSLLLNRNIKVQRTIENYFKNFKESEKIFGFIDDVINKQAERVKSNQRIEVNNEGGDNDKLLVEEILRFIQLCTEGHFLPLQDYFKDQANQRNSYNILKSITNLFSANYSNLNVSNFSIMLYSADTLIELLQGPCRNNQKSILETSVLDTIAKIMKPNFDSDLIRKRQTRRGTNAARRKTIRELKTLRGEADTSEINPTMIKLLKYKTSVLLMAIVEMSSSRKSSYERLAKYLPLELFIYNLYLIFEDYKRVYGKDDLVNNSLNKYNIDEGDYDKQFGYCPIETGFFYYMIMRNIVKECQFYQGKLSKYTKTLILETEKKDKQKRKKRFLLFEMFIFVWNCIYSIYSFLKQANKKIKEMRKVSDVRKNINEEIYRILNGSMSKEIFNLHFKSVIEFFEKNVASIETVYEENVYKVDFIITPYFRYLEKRHKVEFNDNVDRSSLRNKLTSLMSVAPKIINTSKNTYRVEKQMQKICILGPVYEHSEFFKDLAFFILFVINVLVFLSYQHMFPEGSDQNQGMENENALDQFTDNLAVLAIVIVSIIISTILTKEIPVCLETVWSKWPKNLSLFFQILKFIEFILRSILFFLQDMEVLYYLVFASTTFLGVFVHDFFFSFTLTEVTKRFSTMKYILRAIWDPRYEIMLTIALFAISAYFFALVGYILYAPKFVSADQVNCCNTLTRCIICIADTTFKQDSGIGSFLYENNPQDPENFEYVRYIYENLVVVFMVIILLELLSGVIIDTFGALRDMDNLKSSDVKGRCFICGLSVQAFEKSNSTDFNSHIRNHHYMWHYICYISYLMEKEESDFDGVEQYVWVMYNDKDIDWIPQMKAFGLQNNDDSEKNLDRLEGIREDSADAVDKVLMMQDMVVSISDIPTNHSG